MKVTYNIIYENLYEACSIYATDCYREVCDDKEPVHFSKGFIERMTKLIRTVEVHYRSLHHEKRRLLFVSALSKAAMVILIAIAMTVSITMSVEASRTCILDFLAEFFEDHIRITSMNMDPDGEEVTMYEESDSEELLKRYINRLCDSGYSLEQMKHGAGGTVQMIFNGSEELLFSRRVYDNYIVGTIDYNNSESSVKVGDVEVFFYPEKNLWYWSEDEYIYHVVTKLEKEEILDLLEYII